MTLRAKLHYSSEKNYLPELAKLPKGHRLGFHRERLSEKAVREATKKMFNHEFNVHAHGSWTLFYRPGDGWDTVNY